MKKGSTNKTLIIFLALIYVIPIFLSIVILSQFDANNSGIMLTIIGIVWIIAFILTYFLIKEFKNNPYPLSYLVDYETLITYMKEEEKFSYDNNLEAGFHYYLYQNGQKVEIEAWHYIFANNEIDKAKGNIYYYNNEEFNSMESLIENRIRYFEGYILIELVDTDNTMLNNYKKAHPELDVVKHIESLNIK